MCNHHFVWQEYRTFDRIGRLVEHRRGYCTKCGEERHPINSRIIKIDYQTIESKNE